MKEVQEVDLPWKMYSSDWIMKSVLQQEIATDAGLSLS